MTLPKMMPMPTPAPTAPRPPPTPRAIALPASEPSSAAAKTKVRRVASTEWTPCVLVGLGDRAADVDGRERGEDERLKRCDQAELEQEQDDAEGQREHAEHLEAEEHREAAGHEEDDQVAGEDVGEETYGEREQPHEVGEQLQHEQRDGRRSVDARRDEALQVADHALGADALERVREEDDQRERERHGDVRRGGEQREGGDRDAEDVERLPRVGRQRDVADQVGDPDEEEERPDE